MSNWIFSCTPENWEISKKSGFWAVRTATMRDKIKGGDRIIFYVTRSNPPSFLGIYKVVGNWRQAKDPVWHDEVREGQILYPWQSDIEPIQLGTVNYKELSKKLSFVKNKNAWYVYMMGTPANFRRPISEEDYQRIYKEMEKPPITVAFGKAREPSKQKRPKEEVPPIPPDLEKIIAEMLPDVSKIMAEKDEEIRRLRLRIEELEKRITGRPPEEDVISYLQRSEQLGWQYLEYNLYRSLCELIGEDNVTWYGKLLEEEPAGAGPGNPDIVIRAPLAGEPYSVVVEGTKATQRYRQTDEIIAAHEHADKVNTDFALLIAPKFINRAKRVSREKNVLLLTIDGFIGVLNYHREVGGITQEELRNLFAFAQERDPPQIDNAFNEWKKAVDEQRRTLSLAIEVYNRLYEEKDWIYTREEVLKRVNKKRVEEGLRSLKDEEAPTIQKVLEILVMLGATHFDKERNRYKASLTREGFGLRIRKLEELVRRNTVKEKSGQAPSKINFYVS